MWQRIGWIVVILLILSLAIIYTSTWIKSFNDPNELKAADFIAFYTAGRAAQIYGYPSIYEVDIQRVISNGITRRANDQFLLYNHLPYFVPILAIIANDNYHASFLRWDLVLLSAFLLSIWCLIESLYANETVTTRLLLIGGVITFLPLFISLWQGQDTAFFFLGLVLWCVGMLKKNDWLAAVGLVLITVRPHICIALAIPLIIKHHKIFGRFVGFSFLAGIYSLLLVGIKGIIGFLNLLNISAQGEWFGMNPQNMPNLNGLIFRTFNSIDHNTANLISWIFFFIGVILVNLLWFRSKTVHEPLLGLSILIAAMFAPHLHAHDLTVLILPLLFAIHDQKMHIFPPQTIVLLPVVSFTFLIGLLVDSLYFIVPYIVSTALAWRLFVKLQAEKESLNLPTP